ncbi:peptidoglycan DD-metalloendopeptidase family protein [Borrelia sp. A-FGy1]|uniref:peptidoglycan DD-metalloendopeptidase family protein n=1 Tax=Borrelia sp. A-FGy1 TaxID=2608247 RepID=UPI0015F53BC2|nr:peptidoglycan DD-metalloendopeptidase family protein [Borrelia sp. A-FGy1]QMU99598.1 peptidoglycan DD-metalloendopeptidase family protein [Borrelia sp. A-FGy1]
MKKEMRYKIILFLKGLGKLCFIILNSFVKVLKSIYSFFSQNVSFMIVPHVKGNVKNIKISFLTLFLFFLFFLVIFIGFVLLTVNYVTLTSIVKSTEKNYELAESEIEDFRNIVVEINSVANNFSRVLDELRTSLKIKESSIDLNRNKLDGDFVDFLDLQVLDANVIKELSDLKNVKSTIEGSIAPLKSIVKLLHSQNKLLNDIPSLWPIIKGDGIISLHFGPAIEPFTRQWYIHKGIDLAGVRIGTAIVAAADGEVIRASHQSTGYGNFVQIKHKYGLSTLYAHLSRLNTSKGSYVKKGQVIGFLGQTGYSTGPHLHYEVRIGSQVINPDMYLNLSTGASK